VTDANRGLSRAGRMRRPFPPVMPGFMAGIHGFFRVAGIGLPGGMATNPLNHQRILNHLGLIETSGIWGRMCWS
jgi:hypothetical protein